LLPIDSQVSLLFPSLLCSLSITFQLILVVIIVVPGIGGTVIG
jgi:hypothetical protein